MKITIHDLQNVQFAHSYHWDISFPSYNNGGFFPASILDDGLFDFGNDSVEYGAGPFSYPKYAHHGESISVQTYETSNYDLFAWFNKLAKSIYNSQTFTVKLVGNCCIPVLITNQDWQKIDRIAKAFWVIPDGEVRQSNTSDKGGLVELSCSFKIVGKISIVESPKK